MRHSGLFVAALVTLVAGETSAYPVTTTFTIDPNQSQLSVRASSGFFSDTDAQSLSGSIDGNFDFGQTGAFPATAGLTVTSAAIKPNGPFNLRLGFPPFLGVNITASDLVADLSTPTPPGTMTRTGAGGSTYQFDASQFLVTVNQGTIVVTGTTNETTDLSQEPVTGVSPPGTLGTLTFTTLGTSGPYTRVGATLNFPIQITDTAESDTGGMSVDLQLNATIRASASFFVALGGVGGDFDQDGNVDGSDLTVWRTSFGGNGSVGPVADADRDGDADGNDFLIWQRNLGTRPPASGATSTAQAVPEPATLVLGAAALLLIAASSRKPR